jgi:ankyrin repeat protein
MSRYKRPLLQRRETAASAPVRTIRKKPREEGPADSTERTRRMLREIGKGKNRQLLDAAGKGRLWDADNIVRAGADVNAVDEEGKSVLDLAKKSGNKNLVGFLKRKGAKTAAELN